MHAIDEHMDVRELAITVRDDDGLMFLQPQPVEDAVGHAFHRGAIHRVAGVEAEREVIDRLLDAVTP